MTERLARLRTAADAALEPLASDAGLFVPDFYLPEDYVGGLWHVTTDRDRVLAEGLKTRMETQRTGLGGGYRNLAPDTISVTYDEAHASMIEDRLKLAVLAAKGATDLNDIINHFAISGFPDSDPYFFAQALGIRDGCDDWDTFESILESRYGTDMYRLVQELDDGALMITDEPAPGVRIGLTGSAQDMASRDPNLIATLCVEVDPSKFVEHVADEAELRFARGGVVVSQHARRQEEGLPNEHISLIRLRR